MRKSIALVTAGVVIQIASFVILFALRGSSAFIDGSTSPSARPADMLVGYVLLFLSSFVACPLGSWGIYECLGNESSTLTRTVVIPTAAVSNLWAVICGYGLLVLLAVI